MRRQTEQMRMKWNESLRYRLLDKRRKGAGLIALLLMLIAGAFLLGSHVMQQKKEEKKDYGVFLNVDDSVLDQLGAYETVVIDAQYFKE